MKFSRLTLSLSLAAIGSLAALGLAEGGAEAQPSPLAAAIAAASGQYQLDPSHQSVIARVGHSGGVSFSTFRFAKATGTLDWNGANPERSAITMNVDPSSITSIVPNFGTELAGPRFLDSAQFPTSVFISRSIRLTGPKSGVISGDLTLHGVTRPIEVNAGLVGAGKDFRGNSIIGFSGTARFNRADFGITAMPGPIGSEIELVVDLEFKQSPAPAG